MPTERVPLEHTLRGSAETGVLVVARGQELTPGVLAKLHNFFRRNSVIRAITSEMTP